MNLSQSLSNARILVLGGSGFVGRALCETLVDRWKAGPRLRVPTRRLANAQV